MNMFGRDQRGFDILNHAIRLGTASEILRRNDLMLSMNNLNPNQSLLVLAQQAQAQVQAALSPQMTLSQHVPSQSQQQQQQHQQQQQQQQQQSVSNGERVGNSSFQFPFKLYDMLDASDSDGFASIVSWQDNGRAFKVHKPSKFVESIMPVYFKQTKYKSFQRQLNLYGFARINEGARSVVGGGCGK